MRYAFNVPSFLDWVILTWAPVASLADRAAYSRSHFSRTFSRELGESPSVLRSRLRLEAGAYLLSGADYSVGEAAVEVGFSTPEAFTKAFRRAYGRAPREFKRTTSPNVWLESATGIHFHPSGLIVRRQGIPKMQLSEILIRHHIDETTTLLDSAASLLDSQLDMDTALPNDAVPWDRHAPTLRGLLRSIVITEAAWMATFRAEGFPEVPEKPTIGELRAIHDANGTAMVEFVADLEANGLWGSEFVDALCEEPVRFEFGAVIAHIIVFSALRRQLVLAALRDQGIKGLDYGDPINWLRSHRGESVYSPDCP